MTARRTKTLGQLVLLALALELSAQGEPEGRQRGEERGGCSDCLSGSNTRHKKGGHCVADDDGIWQRVSERRGLPAISERQDMSYTGPMSLAHGLGPTRCN
ncbi:hypothetical protein NHX12_003784 [Muraenolepis orangiensis]|uniref:Secreted protein n=1 Tax=Muraenolepis orangiensis TaxID=630683 RepID=A0A9Q0IBL4_9TELE|nr:hypothetical protein NHX12_003784 [Muraenolepis orangiensis]